MSLHKISDSDRNPLIGLSPADTMSQCAQVLEIVDLAVTRNEFDMDDEEMMGYHMIFSTVCHALMWDNEHFSERVASTENLGNISKIPGPD